MLPTLLRLRTTRAYAFCSCSMAPNHNTMHIKTQSNATAAHLCSAEVPHNALVRLLISCYTASHGNKDFPDKGAGTARLCSAQVAHDALVSLLQRLQDILTTAV
jgi:hypothetical protein